MDYIIRELDNKIFEYDFERRPTDAACYSKIKMDYFLMLTIAVAWDMKNVLMDEAKKKQVMNYLQRPEMGKLIQLIDQGFSLHKSIVDIFNLQILCPYVFTDTHGRRLRISISFVSVNVFYRYVFANDTAFQPN